MRSSLGAADAPRHATRPPANVHTSRETEVDPIVDQLDASASRQEGADTGENSVEGRLGVAVTSGRRRQTAVSSGDMGSAASRLIHGCVALPGDASTR